LIEKEKNICRRILSSKQQSKNLNILMVFYVRILAHKFGRTRRQTNK